jgi:hypothetical protein
MAVGKEDGQCAGQLSPSAPPGAMAQAWVTAEGELLTLGNQRTAFREIRRDLREVLEPRTSRQRCNDGCPTVLTS